MAEMTHRERLVATVEGRETDRPAISMWRHFGGLDMAPDALADAMVGFQQEFDWDFVKFMPTGTYSIMDWGAQTRWDPNLRGIREILSSPIERADDWGTLPALDTAKGVFGEVNAALADTVERVGKDTPVLQTIFSPLSTARKLAGDARTLSDLRKEPELFEAGLKTIAAVTKQLVVDAVERGADIFYVLQSGTADVLTADEFERFELVYARELVAAAGDALVFVHSHGDHLWFDALYDLPVAGINWHDQTAYPSLAEARTRTDKALLGGIDGGTLFRAGTIESVSQFIREVAGSVERGLILTPGCVLPTDSSAHLMHAARATIESMRR